MEIVVHGTFIDFLVGYGSYILCSAIALIAVIPAIGAAGGAMNLLQTKNVDSPKDKKNDWLFLCFGTIISLGLWALALFIAKWAFLTLQ